MPWDEIFRVCETTGGTKWYIVEYESDAFPPLEAVERCLSALKEMENENLCASTLPFSPYQLTEFVGGLSQKGMSAIELAQSHFRPWKLKPSLHSRGDRLRFKSMLSTVAVDAPDGLEALISILNTAKGSLFPWSASRGVARKMRLLARLKRLLIVSKGHRRSRSSSSNAYALTLTKGVSPTIWNARNTSSLRSLTKTSVLLQSVSFSSRRRRSRYCPAYPVRAAVQRLFQLWCGFTDRQRAFLGTRDGFSVDL